MLSRLSPDLISQITPMLGSIARLISRFGTVTEAQLDLLIGGEEFPNSPEILGELRRWARLLEKVYESSHPEMQETVIESLRQRGIAEAPAILAVSVIADSINQKPLENKKTRQLSASTTNIDLGVLTVGETAVYDFEVHGGPGQVIFDNECIDVHPMQFGEAPASLCVRIKPSARDEVVFHDQLTLKNELGELLEIDLTVQWRKPIVLPAKIPEESGQVNESLLDINVPIRRSIIPRIRGLTGLAILGGVVVVLIISFGFFHGESAPTSEGNPTKLIRNTTLPIVAIGSTEVSTNFPGGISLKHTPSSKPPATATREVETLTKTPIKKCPGAPKKRVSVGDRVTICTKKETVFLRTEPKASAGYTHRLVPGAELQVIDGPVCDNDKSWWYWKVRTESGYIGWVAEGGDEKDPYFICPQE